MSGVNASVRDHIPPHQLDATIALFASKPGAKSIIVPPELTALNGHLCSANLFRDEDWADLVQITIG
jgi:hypothetical protein